MIQEQRIHTNTYKNIQTHTNTHKHIHKKTQKFTQIQQIYTQIHTTDGNKTLKTPRYYKFTHTNTKIKRNYTLNKQNHKNTQTSTP